MATYQEIKNIQPELFECFFAFSESQYNEGIAKNNLQDKKISRGFGGLYGTQEGKRKLYDDYKAIVKRIAEECDPQDVYDYEFSNHECALVGNDSEAMEIVIYIFKPEQHNDVKRKCVCFTNEEILAKTKNEA